MDSVEPVPLYCYHWYYKTLHSEELEIQLSVEEAGIKERSSNQKFSIIFSLHLPAMSHKYLLVVTEIQSLQYQELRQHNIM